LQQYSAFAGNIPRDYCGAVNGLLRQGSNRIKNVPTTSWNQRKYKRLSAYRTRNSESLQPI